MTPKQVGYRWHLRRLMAEKQMFSTSDLVPLLAERGVQLSPVQVYRLVAQTPERLNLKILAALCDILGCTPTELIETTVATESQRKVEVAKGGGKAKPVRPSRARITRQ